MLEPTMPPPMMTTSAEELTSISLVPHPPADVRNLSAGWVRRGEGQFIASNHMAISDENRVTGDTRRITEMVTLKK